MAFANELMLTRPRRTRRTPVPRRNIYPNRPIGTARYPFKPYGVRSNSFSPKYGYSNLPSPGRYYLGDPCTLGELSELGWSLKKVFRSIVKPIEKVVKAVLPKAVIQLVTFPKEGIKELPKTLGKVAVGAVAGTLTGGFGIGTVGGAVAGLYSKTTKFIPNLLMGAAGGGIAKVATGAISAFKAPVTEGAGLLKSIGGYAEATGSAIKSGVVSLQEAPLGKALTSTYGKIFTKTAQVASTVNSLTSVAPLTSPPPVEYAANVGWEQFYQPGMVGDYGLQISKGTIPPASAEISYGSTWDAYKTGGLYDNFDYSKSFKVSENLLQPLAPAMEGFTWGGFAKDTLKLTTAVAPAYLQMQQIAAASKAAAIGPEMVPQIAYPDSAFEPTVIPNYGPANFPTAGGSYFAPESAGGVMMGEEYPWAQAGISYDDWQQLTPEQQEVIIETQIPFWDKEILSVPLKYWIIGGIGLLTIYMVSTKAKTKGRRINK